MHQSADHKLATIPGHPLRTTLPELIGHYAASRRCQQGQKVSGRTDGVCRKPTLWGLGSIKGEEKGNSGFIN